MPPLSEILTPGKAHIFRITHRANVSWILENGLHCPGSVTQDPDFVSIGNPELIERRRSRPVPIPPGGTLEDYVPFYFTPLSPMLYNITTGYGDIRKRASSEVVILVSSLPALTKCAVPFVFTDRHAYLTTTTFYGREDDLAVAVDFPLLQARDFRRDPENPQKFDRYQAEALAHRHVPAAAILGIGCYTRALRMAIEAECLAAGVAVAAVCRPEWYF